MDLKDKPRQETKKQKGLMKQKVYLICWCCSFHETQAKEQGNEIKRQKQGSKRKQERRKRGKEGRKRHERDKETES